MSTTRSISTMSNADTIGLNRVLPALSSRPTWFAENSVESFGLINRRPAANLIGYTSRRETKAAGDGGQNSFIIAGEFAVLLFLIAEFPIANFPVRTGNASLFYIAIHWKD